MGGIAITGAVYLLVHGCHKGAFALLLAFIGASLFIGIAKIAFIGCGWHLGNQYDLRSPSGHSALSAAVLGTYILIISSQLRGLWRYLPAMLLTPLIFAIAVTRILLNFHSVSEVIVGLAIGGITLLVVHVFLNHGKKLPAYNAYALILYALLTGLILHGFRLPAENLIHYLASYLNTHVSLCSQ